MTYAKEFQFKFFLPNARLLSENEIEDLPAEKKKYAANSGGNGIWLEINCPDGSCLDSHGRITLPTSKSDEKGKGTFVELFCPEDSCEILQSTDLP